jgi:hypothetical protein
MTTPDSETRVRVSKFPIARIFLELHFAKRSSAFVRLFLSTKKFEHSGSFQGNFVRSGISQGDRESFGQRPRASSAWVNDAEDETSCL